MNIKSYILNGQDRKEGGEDILPKVPRQSMGIRKKEKTYFQDGEMTRGAEGEMTESVHPMGDDGTALRRSKRLGDDTPNNLVCSTKSLVCHQVLYFIPKFNSLALYASHLNGFCSLQHVQHLS